MWQRLFFIGAVSVIMMAGHGVVLSKAPASESAVTGKVNLTPSCPGPQRIDQGPCTAPFAGAHVHLRNSAGVIIARTIATVDGAFQLQAPPGEYEIEIAVAGAYPRCETTQVTVRKGRVAEVDISCDSGMR